MVSAKIVKLCYWQVETGFERFVRYIPNSAKYDQIRKTDKGLSCLKDSFFLGF